MCYNCGCQNPQDDMGHPDNITEQTLAQLKDSKPELLKLLENDDKKLEEDPQIKEMFEKAASAWGQSVEEAKKNTYALLKKEQDLS